MRVRNFLILIIMAIILLPNISHAGLQANSNTQYTTIEYSAKKWMINIRKMEAVGGAMGLSETFNTDYTSKTSNNIDVHMMRSTEYGAIAILSASSYGNPDKAKAITTTTGNNTGVILDSSKLEWTAGTSLSFATNARYWDQYSNDSGATYKVGDALVECKGWHSADKAVWVTSTNYYFKRGGGGIFSYTTRNNSHTGYCRGVAVCGTGM